MSTTTIPAPAHSCHLFSALRRPPFSLGVEGLVWHHAKVWRQKPSAQKFEGHRNFESRSWSGIWGEIGRSNNKQNSGKKIPSSWKCSKICEIDKGTSSKPMVLTTSLIQLLVLLPVLSMRHEFRFPLHSWLLWAAGAGRKAKCSTCPAKRASQQRRLFSRCYSDVTQFPWSHHLMLVAITTC